MKKIIICILALFLLNSCAPARSQASSVDFFAMDTYMTVTVYGADSDAASAAKSRILELEDKFDRTDPESEISRINAAGVSGCEVSEDTAHVISLSLYYGAVSDGAFDISIGSVMDAWGFGMNDSGTPSYRVPGDTELAELLKAVGADMVSVLGSSVKTASDDVVIDLGGVGKGYAAQAAADVLRAEGVKSALLSLGGNICAVGSKPDGSPWRAAIQSPSGDGYAGVIEFSDASVVTTGGYRRYFEENGVRYHHVIDPATGRPADSGLLSATVVCSDSAVADILSTAVFVMGEEKALALRERIGGFELVLLTDDGRAVVTSGLADCFELAEGSGFVLDNAD